MSVSLDPEQHETKALLEVMGDLRGKRVLEIGCGDGRLTRRYADRATQVVAIDPDPELISQALESTPPNSTGRVSYYADSLEGYAAKRQMTNPEEDFDLVLLAWSL